ncbi:CheR family methyltransferase [Azospirillum halopraeferens]|uniref:CheR family methyltransferase n=1 Tax=Azospirillum halopraeferens TaxID=34010 RepID=UPI000427FD17|nr:protein-glutamate O-methyltransferase CheR [Azospirillum halopraeferens]
MSASGGTSPATPEEYETLCAFLRQRTGLSFGENKRYFVDRRLADRMAANGIRRFREYMNLLRFQPSGEELQQLVNLLTVNETYFLREKYQLDCLVRSVLAEVVKERPKGSPIRIWSAGCSTGEEPYSIALTLLENWEHVDDYDIELYASDIDSSALARARDGIYEARSLQYVPPGMMERYFTALGDGRWQIVEELRQSVDFSLANITDPEQVRRFRSLDVVFCRNLLIYFDDLGRREAAAMFYDALVPEGFVMLGHSESMSRMSSLFVPRKFPDAIVYQKPRAGVGDGP